MSLSTQIKVLGGLPTAGSPPAASSLSADEIAAAGGALQSAVDSEASARVAADATLRPIVGASGQRDGDATIPSGTTTMTGPKQYGTLTLQTGAILFTNGFELHAKKIIQQGTGRISGDGTAGNSASGATGGGAVSAFSNAFGTLQQGGAPGSAGASGGTGVGASASQSTLGLSNNIGGSGGPGGYANSGGSGSSGAGGDCGSAVSNYSGIFAPFSLGPLLRAAQICTGGTPGGNGGAGAGDGSNSGGGGGGSATGGLIVDVWAGEIDVSAGSGPVITADGGAGGAGGNSSAGNTGGGGGACGAGGGMIRCIVGKITGTASPGIRAAGGAGGAGGNGQGSGTGGRGGQGATSGNIYFYRADTQAWATVVSGASGSAPSTPGTTTGSAGTAGATGSVNF